LRSLAVVFLQRFTVTYVLRAQEAVRSLVMNIYPVDVVSKDVLKSFRNLLQSGDRTSAERLVEDLDILWASDKVVKR